MPTYLLMFDPTGRDHEDFQVPAGKLCYLVRAPQAANGTATVTDLLSLTNYTLPGGVTIINTGIAPGKDVALAFMSRSDPSIQFINAEVISPRDEYS
jgi:hypothetical protein